MPKPTATLAAILRMMLAALAVGSFLLAAAVWLVPIEVMQSWAIDRAPQDEFSQQEAYHATTATVWCVRWGATAAGLAFAVASFRSRTTVPHLVQFVMEFWRAATASHCPQTSATFLSRAGVIRLLLVAWMGLAVYHAGVSIQRRLWDWPVYRLHAGSTILPNISDSNRDVIRYLEATTKPGSRIYVVSDQKLFFLSYYLLPRRLYHPTHPDSEFVIPQAHNQRQLAAYQLSDLSPEQISRVRPDYILQYFESAPYFADQNLEQDSNWMRFQRSRRGPDWQPRYFVNLRRYQARGTQ